MSTAGTGGRNLLIVRRGATLLRNCVRDGALIHRGMAAPQCPPRGRRGRSPEFLFTQGPPVAGGVGSLTSTTRRRGLITPILGSASALDQGRGGNSVHIIHRDRAFQLKRTSGVEHARRRRLLGGG